MKNNQKEDVKAKLRLKLDIPWLKDKLPCYCISSK